MKPPTTLRAVGVIIIEPLRVLRAALRKIFDSLPDMHVLGETSSIREGLDLIRQAPPGPGTLILLSLDSGTKGESFRMISSIREEFPSVSILVTAARTDNVEISRAFFVGADSYVAQERDVEELVDAIRQTARGEMVIVASRLDRGARETRKKSRSNGTLLTEREIQVLSVASEGLTARQVARKLNIRERTVTAHFSHIYKKFGVSNRAAALTAASDAGLLDGPSHRHASRADGDRRRADLSAS